MKDTPVGRLPDAKTNEYGATPPLTVSSCATLVPTMTVDGFSASGESARGRTVSVYDFSALTKGPGKGLLSLALTVNVYVPAVEGVPPNFPSDERTPPEEESSRHQDERVGSNAAACGEVLRDARAHLTVDGFSASGEERGGRTVSVYDFSALTKGPGKGLLCASL